MEELNNLYYIEAAYDAGYPHTEQQLKELQEQIKQLEAKIKDNKQVDLLYLEYLHNQLEHLKGIQ